MRAWDRQGPWGALQGSSARLSDGAWRASPCRSGRSWPPLPTPLATLFFRGADLAKSSKEPPSSAVILRSHSTWLAPAITRVSWGLLLYRLRLAELTRV